VAEVRVCGQVETCVLVSRRCERMPAKTITKCSLKVTNEPIFTRHHGSRQEDRNGSCRMTRDRSLFGELGQVGAVGLQILVDDVARQRIRHHQRMDGQRLDRGDI
jgi:hypothetical protein